MMNPSMQFLTANSKLFTPILEEALSYKFEERPNYGKLRFMLAKILLDDEVFPDLFYSWTPVEQLMNY